MNDKLILVIVENCEFYRLNMYHDFVERLSLFVPNVKVYGRDYKQLDQKYIKTYRPEKTIQDIIREDLNGKCPDIIFLVNADFAASDFSLLPAKVFVFLSDSVSTNMGHVNTVNKHKFKCEGVFYNYLYGQEKICQSFNTQNKFHWPCWSAMKYNYLNYGCSKTIDFFMSGTITDEYSYRQKFRDVFKSSGLNFVDDYMKTQDNKENNDRFLKLLSASRYSPHDGGINGRMQGRFFESGFMKSVIISPDLGEEMRVNGFVHGENCILFDRNIDEKELLSVFKNINEKHNWERLSDNAYLTIKNRHTTDIRIKQFLEVVFN